MPSDSAPRQAANIMVLERVLDKMGADTLTKLAVTNSIGNIIEAIRDQSIEAGTSCVNWKDGKESSVVASIGPGMIQMLRLGHDNQVRGDIWLIREHDDRIVAAPITAIDDYSNHEAMRRQAEATTQHLQNIKDAQCMSQRLLGKANDYQEPTVPEHLRFQR